MRRLIGLSGALVLAAALAGAPARATPGARVIVSTTLNDTLQVFDAATLAEVQPPLPSKGVAPVRMWVQRVAGRDFLLTANHGAPAASVGVFALDAPVVLELPLSPFPARAGAVGIAAANFRDDGEEVLVFVTNSTFALGGCGMPAGSVTAYTARDLGTLGILTEIGTVELPNPIPFAVAADGAGYAFASTSCGARLESIRVLPTYCYGPAPCPDWTLTRTASRETGAGPDATWADPARGLVYTANIDGSSLSVHDRTTPGARTTVPMPGARPIDLTLATSPAGAEWVITSNGGNDSVSLVDRDVVDGCVAAGSPSCPQALALTVPTGVAGGAPEGVAYDPETNRVFAVNKNVFAPSLTVVQLAEGPLSGAVVGRIPLGAAGATAPVPAFIAFDVVVAPAAP